MALFLKDSPFLDGYCSTVQDLLDWFEVDLVHEEKFVTSHAHGTRVDGVCHTNVYVTQMWMEYVTQMWMSHKCGWSMSHKCVCHTKVDGVCHTNVDGVCHTNV